MHTRDIAVDKQSRKGAWEDGQVWVKIHTEQLDGRLAAEKHVGIPKSIRSK